MGYYKNKGPPFFFLFLLSPENNISKLFPLSTLLAHSSKHALFPVPVFSLLPELPRRPVLGDGSVAEDEDAVEVGDGAQTVRNDKQGSLRELIPDAPLDKRVRVHVDRRGRLVQNHDARAADDGSRKAQQLTLALREVEAALGDGGLEVLEDVGVLRRRVDGWRGGVGRSAGRRGGDARG